MIDICFPKNNEQEFIKIAERLGTKNILFVYEDANKFYKKEENINVFNALITSAKNVEKARNKSDLIMVKSDGINDRLMFEKTKPDLIFCLEETQKKDFMHQRASGLNHIHARLANQNKIIIGFSFSSILNKEGAERSRIIGRIMQNINLCRKFKVKTCIASFTQHPFELRSLHDLQSFFINLGMHQKEAKSSTNCLFEKIRINQKKKKGEYHESVETAD